MFSYKTFTWNKKIAVKSFSFFCIAVYILSLIPVLVIGHFNWPAVDDFSMALEPHQYFIQTGNFIGTIGAAFVKTIDIYNTWIGYYFSSFMTCVCPGIFGEKWYFLVGYMILGMFTWGVFYFFDALFVHVWKLDKYLTRSIAAITLFIAVQCMETGTGVTTRSESFFWYSGAINYTFMFGVALLWIGLLLRAVFDEKKSGRIRKLIFASVLGFLLGGANYMTALGMAIISVIIIFLVIMIRIGRFKFEDLDGDDDKEKALPLILIPAVLNIIGLMCSAFAPGTRLRSDVNLGDNPIKAVLRSFYHTLDVCVNDMTRWEVLLLFAVIAVISWKLADGMLQELHHPFLFTLFCYSFVSANITPPLYAVGNIDAGRLRGLVWLSYVVAVSLVIFYITVWVKQELVIKQKVTGDDAHFSPEASFLVVLAGLFIVLGSTLSVYANHYYYSCTSAVTDLANGTAKKYYGECSDRLVILEDDSVKDVVLTEHEYKPEIIYYLDVTTDKDEWVNTITAKYYNKDFVQLKLLEDN